MFWQMITIEQQKMTRRAMFWLELGLLLLVLIALIGGIFYVRQALLNDVDLSDNEGGLVITGIDLEMATELLTWPAGVMNGFTAVEAVGTFLIIILAGSIVAQEYSWRTVQLWPTRGVPRSIVLAAKFTALSIAAFLFVFLVVILGLVLTAVFSQAYLDHIPFDTIDWGQLFLSIMLRGFTLLPYVAITFFLGVISRSTIGAIGGGLAFVIFIEPLWQSLAAFLGGRWLTINEYLPVQLKAVIHGQFAAISAAAPAASGGEVGLGTAVVVMSLYILICVTAALLVFQRQDIGG